ncbi:cytochrome c3 family protein [Thermodesulfitimonas sp.]
MTKAKLYLVSVVALVCCLAFAAPAFAWTHGQFSATTDACGGCHVAHAANLPKLLKAGATQTHFLLPLSWRRCHQRSL